MGATAAARPTNASDLLADYKHPRCFGERGGERRRLYGFKIVLDLLLGIGHRPVALSVPGLGADLQVLLASPMVRAHKCGVAAAPHLEHYGQTVPGVRGPEGLALNAMRSHAGVDGRWPVMDGRRSEFLFLWRWALQESRPAADKPALVAHGMSNSSALRAGPGKGRAAYSIAPAVGDQPMFHGEWLCAWPHVRCPAVRPGR